MPEEVERKWLATSKISPAILSGAHKVVPIKQGYILTEEGELRIRKRGEEYFLDAKGEGTLVRESWKTPIPPWMWELFSMQVLGALITKKRHYLFYGSHELMIDVYEGQFAGLVLIECEFADGKAARNFQVPEFFGSAREVTHDTRYKNKHLALWGVPEDPTTEKIAEAAHSH